MAHAEENLMRAMGAPRTWALTAALMLAIGVVACAADEDTSAPGELPSAEPAALSEEVEGPAEPAKESPDGSGAPAAEPEEEEAPEADRE